MSIAEAEKKTHVRQPFTEKNLNKLLKNVLKESERIRQIQENWIAFVTKELRLNDIQKKNLGNIPEEYVRGIQEAFNNAIENGGDIDVTFGSESGLKTGSKEEGGTLQIKGNKAPDSTTDVSPRFTLIIFHCTFDADCGNWQCDLGPDL